jgi:hypothetical protein
MEKEPFSLEAQIESLCKNGLRKDVIHENSTMGKFIVKSIPNFSITDAVEKILKPEYANSVFTWHQITEALNKRQF